MVDAATSGFNGAHDLAKKDDKLFSQLAIPGIGPL